MKTVFAACVTILFSLTCFAAEPLDVKRAGQCHGIAEASWPVGCNFIPSTAINQLEMWQKDTYDPNTIDRELGWAEQIGFNTVRVLSALSCLAGRPERL